MTFTNQYGEKGHEIIVIPHRKFLNCKECDKILGVIHWDIETDGITNWGEDPDTSNVQCMECFYKDES